MDLLKRPRRLRINENMRKLVRETSLSVNDFIYPLFIVEGENIREEIPSMPGVYHLSMDEFLKELSEINQLGILGVLLFGVPDHKDELGTSAYDDQGIVQRALRAGKESFPELLMIADVCLCSYTSHGHCGILHDGKILNDPSVALHVKTALSYAKAGADLVAPSDMMDGRVLAIREGLDQNRFEEVGILAYSIKFASSFYGPFRDAAHSTPTTGDRKSYQMDYCNGNQALLQAEADIQAGADIIMVKPALAYLDIISQLHQITKVPIAAYNVSGEYAMIKAAAQKGWINEKAIVLEAITAMKRAGASIIITYYAKDLAQWLIES